MRAATVVAVVAAGAVLGCQPADSSLGRLDDSGDGIGGSTSTGGDGDGGSAPPTDSAPDDDSGEGPSLKLDVGASQFDIGGGPGCDGRPCPCSGVDLLFVVDDSDGMAGHQAALAAAFPSLLEALGGTLPAGTELHLGVTSTTMGDSETGTSMGCEATGDRGQPAAAFYETPDVANNALQGAQGRLMLAAGMPFFTVQADATGDERAAAVDWFSMAANLGEDGSEIEMSAAAASWATDPANDATNLGFIAGSGSILGIVVVQDEPDQSPTAEESGLVARIADAKAGCGGAQCVVAGGFVDMACLPESPLGGVMTEFGGPQTSTGLPATPDADAMAELLGGAFADALTQACLDVERG